MEMVGSVDDLMTSQSIAGHRFWKFEIPNEKIASALILQEESQSGAAQSAKCKTHFAVGDRLPQ